MALMEVKVPDIGDFESVEIIEVLVKPGDRIKAEQSLVTVESDKASMEIPSSHAGVVKELRVALGDKVRQGSVVLMLEAADAAGQAAAAEKAPQSTPDTQTSSAREEGSADDMAVSPQPAGAVAVPGSQPPAAPAASGATASAPSGAREVVVPDIGDFDQVAVIELLVQPGDSVTAEQSLITVESDKASMEIPSSHAGKIERVLVKVGDSVSKGTPIVVLAGAASAEGDGAGQSAGASAPSQAVPAQAPGAAPAPALASRPVERTRPTAGLPAHEPSAPQGRLPHASPSVRRFARELGVPLEQVKGSGPKERITQEDVQAYVKGVMAGGGTAATPVAKATGGGGLDLLPWPKVDFAKFGEIERKDLSRIKKISGANLHRNWVVIPHVTNHDDADITELEAFRVQLNKEYEKAGVKVTMLAFLIKACVAALKKFPEFNASLDGEQLVLKKYFHVGFAADTPNGLVVPVIRDADKKGLVAIAKEMNELAAKARDGKLGPAEMSGGCFSISSLGGIGGTYFTPIINAPEVSILGVCKSQTRPVWDGKAFVPRLILPLSLSWDHRVIDGASAARFNAYLGAVLADFRRVML
ncbi:MAG: dihydrolipoyllysine-residue acetyltransferase [Methylibium sp.]|uniref:dihydrolipoyllysine-residue acetyltransferase n=1 Tax=Methylibium sp. TaxID=2067992 RepID=UPI001827EEC5|nr:dihydrolipoyllysine-residue acetyltransferase [Methylibium sp.]MBA3597530.1 dihydrolipoyllysine-residue acetyltransferase [Methylibium sp.]